MCTRKPRLVLVSLMIGWKNGARTLIQSLSEVMQNKSNSLITFDTQLKTALPVQIIHRHSGLWLASKQKGLVRTNQIFCFQIKQIRSTFFKDYKLHSPYGLLQFWSSLKKNYSCLFIPNCTRNLVSAYTNGIWAAGRFLWIDYSINDSVVSRQYNLEAMLRLSIYRKNRSSIVRGLHLSSPS